MSSWKGRNSYPDKKVRTIFKARNQKIKNQNEISKIQEYEKLIRRIENFTNFQKIHTEILDSILSLTCLKINAFHFLIKIRTMKISPLNSFKFDDEVRCSGGGGDLEARADSCRLRANKYIIRNVAAKAKLLHHKFSHRNIFSHLLMNWLRLDWGGVNSYRI